MTTEQIEQRLQNIESKVSQLAGRFDSVYGSDPKAKWWEKIRPFSDELRETWEEAAAYGRYYRKTGKDAPPDWKPGDLIPEPDPEWMGIESTETLSGVSR